MNSSAAGELPAAPSSEKSGRAISRLIRRIHMFTGLFLAPWMLMYALSTLVMTHSDFVFSFYSSKSPTMVTERELDYTRSFPTDVTREQIGQQILQDIGLDGTHYVSGGKDGKPLVVNRQHALIAQRITFDASKSKVVMEREEFRTPTFLERLHRRRGYNHPYALEDTWGFTVDVAVVTMVFWSLSGVWLWWELKSTRGWGTLALTAGVVLFAIFVVLL